MIMKRYIPVIGLFVILVAAALPFFHLPREVSAWTYAVGSVTLLAGRFLNPAPKGADIRLRRLFRMEIWAALVFVAGAVFLFLPVKPGAGAGNDWLAFTIAGGVLTVYTSIMIPREQRRSM